MMCFGLKDRKRIKTNHCVIVLLDDTQLVHELHASSTGQDLLDVVIKHLNLIETSYFGLKYLDNSSTSLASNSLHSTTTTRKHTNDGGGGGNGAKNRNHRQHQHRPMEQIWLDVDKSAIKQLRDVQPMTVYFGVKYYASDPCKLAEEITRYQFFLQCKQDILHSRLPITFDLAIELFALAVQSELGDHDPQRHREGYVSEFQFLLNQTMDLEKRVALFHRNLTGQVPATAELNFLERVKWLDLYGCELHPIQYEDNPGEEYALGLNPSGVLVLRNKLKVAHYLWPRIEKTKSQGRCFLMDVIDNKASSGRNRFGFRLIDKAASRRLRQAVEEHKSFFTLVNNSATLNQLAHRQQQQQQQHMNLSQRFRNSIRSAINVGPFGGFHHNQNNQNELIMQQQQQQQHQRLRSSMKSLANHQQLAMMQQQQAAAAVHYALDSRPPPTVVRMPSRRYSNKSQQVINGQYCTNDGVDGAAATTNGIAQLSSVNSNGLPLNKTNGNGGGGAHTMVDSQRQQAMILMNQFNQMNGMIGKSQTLKPMPVSGNKGGGLDSKEAKRNSYYHQMMMMAMMAAQNNGLGGGGANGGRQDVSIVPPGRHIVQPNIYKASSIVNGINQLGGQAATATASMSKEQAEALAQRGAMMQFFNTQAQYPGYRGSNGHESPRSTKSAIGPGSAMKLASKKLAKQQLQMQLQLQQHHLLYDNNHQPEVRNPPSLAYDLHNRQPSYHHQQATQQPEYYGVSGGPYTLGSTSANTSPRSMRSNRLMSTRHKSKSTNENLNLLHNTNKYIHHHHQQQQQQPSKMLLATTQLMHHQQQQQMQQGGQMGPPPPGYHNGHGGGNRQTGKFNHQMGYSGNESDASKMSKNSAMINKKRATFALDNDQANSLLNTSDGHLKHKTMTSRGQSEADDDYCCSRSDCSSIDGGDNDNGGDHQVKGQPMSGSNQRRRRLSANNNSNSKPRVMDDQQEWNAIRRRHNEFLLHGSFSNHQQPQDSPPINGSESGSRSMSRRQLSHSGANGQDDYGDDLNNNNIVNSQGSQLVKNIANKQATPILLSMNYDQGNNANNKAIQLLNLQRQQLNSQSSDGTKSSSSVVDSANSSVASSPQATQGSGGSGGSASGTSGGNQQLALKPNKTTDSTASSSTTSGYYAGSNSTGSASIDSDSCQTTTLDGNRQALLGGPKNSTAGGNNARLSGNRYQPPSSSSPPPPPSSKGGNYHSSAAYNNDWNEEGGNGGGSRAKIALGAHHHAKSRLPPPPPPGNRQSNNGNGSPANHLNLLKSSGQMMMMANNKGGGQLQQQQQFYLGDLAGGNNNEIDCHAATNQRLPPQTADEMNQQWSPLNQIQQNAPSSLKYVSFDV